MLTNKHTVMESRSSSFAGSRCVKPHSHHVCNGVHFSGMLFSVLSCVFTGSYISLYLPLLLAWISFLHFLFETVKKFAGEQALYWPKICSAYFLHPQPFYYKVIIQISLKSKTMKGMLRSASIFTFLIPNTGV